MKTEMPRTEPLLNSVVSPRLASCHPCSREREAWLSFCFVLGVRGGGSTPTLRGSVLPAWGWEGAAACPHRNSRAQLAQSPPPLHTLCPSPHCRARAPSLVLSQHAGHRGPSKSPAQMTRFPQVLRGPRGSRPRFCRNSALQSERISRQTSQGLSLIPQENIPRTANLSP